MSLARLVLNCILGPVYLVSKLFHVRKNKVSFVSLSSDKLEGDFKIIARKLEAMEKYEIEYVLIKFKRTIPGCFAYFICLLKQVYHINTSHLVILDSNNYAVSYFKKPEVKVVQVWHASGALKKFGNDVERSYEIRNYDYVLACADVWKPYYASAFGVNEDQVVPIGIPRTDRIFNKKRMKKYHREIHALYPQIKGKKVIVFAPTFRGNIMKDYTCEKIDLDHIRKVLGDDYCIIYKLHPLIHEGVVSYDDMVINANEVSIKRLFAVADYLITDYSSVVFEYSVLNKPVIFYTPDLEKYKEEVGMYLPYEETMPGPICYNEDEILDAILTDNFSMEDIKAFRHRFFKYQDGRSTARVVHFIESIMEQEV